MMMYVFMKKTYQMKNVHFIIKFDFFTNNFVNFKNTYLKYSDERHNSFWNIDTDYVSNRSCVHIDHRKTIYYHFSQAQVREFYCDSVSNSGDFNHKKNLIWSNLKKKHGIYKLFWLQYSLSVWFSDIKIFIKTVFKKL